MALLPASSLAAPGDENWDDRFGPLGVEGNVNAIEVNGTNVYVGGAFTRAGGSNILNLARWNGRSWSALGMGISNTANPYVYALAADVTDLYVGGAFTIAGGVLVNHIARWDGVDWWPMGTGVISNWFRVEVVNPLSVGRLHFGFFMLGRWSAGIETAFGMILSTVSGQSSPEMISRTGTVGTLG